MYAAAFAAVIIVLTGAYAAFSSMVAPPSPSVGAAEQAAEPAMPIPDGGAKPAAPGDRGGSEQLGLLAGIIVVLTGGSAWVVHSSRKARRARAAEHDGVTGDGDAGSDDDVPGDRSANDVSVSSGSPTPR